METVYRCAFSFWGNPQKENFCLPAKRDVRKHEPRFSGAIICWNETTEWRSRCITTNLAGFWRDGTTTAYKMSWLLPEGQNCWKGWRRRKRKPAGLKPEQARPGSSCPAGASQRGLHLQGRRPSLPCRRPRRENERAPSERGSEAERQRGGTARTPPTQPRLWRGGELRLTYFVKEVFGVVKLGS